MAVTAGNVDRVCVHCGKVVARDREQLCNQCGEPFGPQADPLQAVVRDNPAAIVRVYRGRHHSDAIAAFQRDAQALAARGYAPTTQSWAQGQYGCGAFLLALLLAVVLIGVLIFIYMLIVKAEGKLTVTYARATAPMPTEDQIPATELSDRLAQLDAARDAGLITADEHAAKRAAIIAL